MPRPVKLPAIYEDTTYKLIGIGYGIHKELGSFHKEQVYQKAFREELIRNKMLFEQEKRLPVVYKGKNIGVYIPDFVVDGKVILELKATNLLPVSAGTQLNYYLKVTGYRVGLLLNFGTSRLQIRRRIYG